MQTAGLFARLYRSHAMARRIPPIHILPRGGVAGAADPDYRGWVEHESSDQSPWFTPIPGELLGANRVPVSVTDVPFIPHGIALPKATATTPNAPDTRLSELIKRWNTPM